MNILLIALEFPPIQAAGAFRGLRFAANLPEFGITPVVVSFNPKQLADGQVHVFNPTLEDRVPAGTPIYYIDLSALEPGRAPLDPKAAAAFGGRHCYTISELLENIAQHHLVDAIWATCPPFHVGPLARAAKAHFDRPLVIDMRDAWSQWGSAPFRTWFHYRHIVRQERKLLDGADAVVCVTPQLLEMERAVSRNPSLDFVWIPNAHDDISLHKGTIVLTPGNETIRIGYAGQFYFNAKHEDANGIIPWYRKPPHRWLHYYATRQRWLYRTPYFFFRTWRTLLDTLPNFRERIEFHYVGPADEWLKKMARSFRLEDRCNWHGIKSKGETQEIMASCSALLSTSIKVLGGEDYCLASKTFDYISVRRPVFGFVSPGTQRDFLEKSNIAVLFDPDDPQGSASKLGETIAHGVILHINGEYLQRYTSRTTSRELADLLRRIRTTYSERATLSPQI